MSTFGGIQQASSSLAASQYGLQIVSQNIANASTPGYTRESVDQVAVDSAGGVPRRYVSSSDVGGVQIAGTQRLNDSVIDARDRVEHSRSALADTTATQLGSIEAIFPEPSNTGLAEQLNTFWNDWSAVANDPGSTAPRAVLLQDGATVASTLNAMSTSLSDVGAAASQSLGNDVDSANTAASALSKINSQIAVGNATGANVNPLLDQRDTLLGQLSSLVGGVATLNANGTANVTVGGQALVTAATSSGSAVLNTIAVNPAAATPSTMVSVGGSAVTLGGGSAAASVNTLTTTLPQVQNQLDSVATALASAVNTAQSNGYDLSGSAGTPIYSVPVSTGPGSVAAGIKVTMTDPTLIAASSTASASGNLDGGNALVVSGLGTQSGSADSVYQSLVGSVGAASKLAQQQQTTQDTVTSSVDTLRQSASGVNMDEEISNMLTLQHAYQASARVLNTMNSMLDTLINHTGA